MMKFGEFVKTLRTEHGWTQQQLASRMEGSVPNVQRIERMAKPEMQARTFASLAKAFGMSSEAFDRAWRNGTAKGPHPDHPQLGRPIPIVNRAFASRFAEKGDMDYPPGFADGYVYAPHVTDRDAFAFVIEGECMEPDYFEGETVICSPNAPFVDGADYLVQLVPERGSQNTFKRVFLAGDNYRLHPVNPAFADREVVVKKDEVYRMARALYVQRPAGPRRMK